MKVNNGCNPNCPACRHRQLTQAESLALKKERLFGKLLPWTDRIQSIRHTEGDNLWHYREKVCLNARFEGSAWHFGMISRDVLIPVENCPVHSKAVNRNLEILGRFLPAADILPLAYFVQVNNLVTLVVKGSLFPGLSWVNEGLVNSLRDNGVEGFAIHHNPSAGKRLFEKTGWMQVFGDIFSIDSNGYRYSRTTFQQVISSLHHESLQTAKAFLEPGENDRVVDLYCGTGISLSYWISAGAAALGIETGADSVACAAVNAPEAMVLRGSCRTRLPQIRDWLQSACSRRVLFYVNPPRTGLESEVLDFIVEEARPERIAYLSCSAGTLRRDLDILTANGYMAAGIVPFDFFPWTHHVECLALLQVKMLS